MRLHYHFQTSRLVSANLRVADGTLGRNLPPFCDRQIRTFDTWPDGHNTQQPGQHVSGDLQLEVSAPGNTFTGHNESECSYR